MCNHVPYFVQIHTILFFILTQFNADHASRVLSATLYYFPSAENLCHGLLEVMDCICFQKTLKRLQRSSKKCSDKNKPKNNVYGEKYPVNFSEQVIFFYFADRINTRN